MVFNRSLKAGIKKILAKSILIVVFFTTVGVFVFNAVFAASNISVPVEVIWPGNDLATRPTQVTLELRKNGVDHVLQTITLNSTTNVDPNNANRWIGEFTNISADAGDTFVVSEQVITNYQQSGSSQATVTGNPGGTMPKDFGSLSKNGNVNLDAMYEYVFVKLTGGGYYLWTYDDYSSSYASIVSSICDSLGLTINQSSVGYFHGASVTQYHINVRYNSNGHTYVRLNGSESADSVHAGNINAISAPIITVTNAIQGATHTLTVHHINEDNTPFAADTVITYDDGDTYTATPINDPDYEPELQGGAASGIITSDIVLTYVYHPVVYFAPTITATITNPQTSYQVGDTVSFSVTVTNPESYALTDVHITELLSGANFISGTGYTLINSAEALIATLPANSSIVLQAEYPVIEDIAQNLVNEFQITAVAAGAHHYLDPDGSYTANISFAVRSQDPPLTGIETSNLPSYVGFIIISLLGVTVMIIVKIRTI